MNVIFIVLLIATFILSWLFVFAPVNSQTPFEIAYPENAIYNQPRTPHFWISDEEKVNCNLARPGARHCRVFDSLYERAIDQGDTAAGCLRSALRSDDDLSSCRFSMRRSPDVGLRPSSRQEPSASTPSSMCPPFARGSSTRGEGPSQRSASRILKAGEASRPLMARSHPKS